MKVTFYFILQMRILILIIYLFLVNQGKYTTTDGQVNPSVYAYTNFDGSGAAATTFYLGSDFLTSDLPNFDSMVAKGASHEIGHALGIKDQSDSQQTAGESVMNHAVDPNDSGNNMPTTVRSCDNQGVKTSYSNSGSGVGDGGGGGYTTYTYQYIIEDDIESGCACYTHVSGD